VRSKLARHSRKRSQSISLVRHCPERGTGLGCGVAGFQRTGHAAAGGLAAGAVDQNRALILCACFRTARDFFYEATGLHQLITINDAQAASSGKSLNPPRGLNLFVTIG